MSEEVKNVEQLEPSRSVSPALPGVFVSRVIEYLPLGGSEVIARDCSYGGKSYSKGALLVMDDEAVHECSGDKEGSWKKVKPS